MVRRMSELDPADAAKRDAVDPAEIAEDYDPVEGHLYEDDVEDAEALETDDDAALARFDKGQRDLVTSVVDYNLGTLSDLIHREKIDLSPNYQRRFRWDRKRQSKLIESFLMNVPIPPIFLSEDRYGTYAVIDGKQRLFAIRQFLGGGLRLKGLEVFDEINDATFDDLPSRLKDIIETRATLRAIIILPQSQPAVKFEVFKRLNTGGVRLNPQEIRNSSYPGPLNNLILRLSESREFHSVLGIADKNRSAIYREMRDAEFVLRYFTFRDTWDTFRGGVMRRMDAYMDENQHLKGQRLREAEADFLHTLGNVHAALGDNAFRRWVPEASTWRRQVLASLYDAQMFAMRGRDPRRIAKRRASIEEGVKALFSDGEFRAAIDAATNTPKLLRTRVRMLSDTLDRTLA